MKKFIKKCPCCGSKDFKESNIEVEEGKLLVCNKCSQLVSQCNEDQYLKSLGKFDNLQGTLPQEDKSLKRAYKLHENRLKKIFHLINKDKENIRLLDVGCSSGSFLDSAKRFGLKKIYGVEPAEKSAETAIKNGHNVKIGFLEDVHFNKNSFDVVTLFEVIEHLKEPTILLSEIYKVLDKNGVLVMSTGNTDSFTKTFMKEKWDYFDLNGHGGHISFFNLKSFEILAKITGFELEVYYTRNLTFYKKNDVSKLKYRISKVISELLKPMISKIGKGHDIVVFFRKK